MARTRQLGSRRINLALVFAAAVLVFAGLNAASAGDAAKKGYKYFCGCGAACECKTVSDKPGQCSCGQALIQKKILKEDEKSYSICSCGKDCDCQSVSKENSGKCGCGKDLIPFPKKKT